jgi:hypothetical protein
MVIKKDEINIVNVTNNINKNNVINIIIYIEIRLSQLSPVINGETQSPNLLYYLHLFGEEQFPLPLQTVGSFDNIPAHNNKLQSSPALLFAHFSQFDPVILKLLHTHLFGRIQIPLPLHTIGSSCFVPLQMVDLQSFP